MNDLNRLQAILTYKRPHGSKTLDTFVADIFAGYEYAIMRNPEGAPLALVIEVGTGSKTLFSSHLDTVHRTEGRQAVSWDDTTGLAWMPEAATECLGADDGAGVWLMLQMVDAAVAGTYVFHYGEERGGVGSSGMATYHEDFLTRHDRAVAFDRRGNTSVITHQGWGRCCSDVFSSALAFCLNDANQRLSMAPDDTGIFTDTANYVELIPECTNLSCGYDSEHSANEMLDFEFLLDLRDAVLVIDWEALPTKRVAGREPMAVYDRRYNFDDVDTLIGMKYGALLKWVKKNAGDPELIADVLTEALDRLTEAEEMAYEPAPWREPSGPYFGDDLNEYKDN